MSIDSDGSCESHCCRRRNFPCPIKWVKQSLQQGSGQRIITREKSIFTGFFIPMLLLIPEAGATVQRWHQFWFLFEQMDTQTLSKKGVIAI